MEPDIAENLRSVRTDIADSELRSGRSVGSVELLAVSKTHPPEAIRQAVEAGQLLFGENRVQEAKAKIADLPARLRWHLIGHLQSNKIRQALPLFEMFHGVDSVDLVDEIQRIAGEPLSASFAAGKRGWGVFKIWIRSGEINVASRTGIQRRPSAGRRPYDYSAAGG
jgi:uncharacterized pyridoxal phosphate-containing UPF0001 family protein